MSRIDELIQDLCPNGVEFVAVSDLFDLRNGYTPSKSEESFWSGGSIPWFRMEDLRENGTVLDRALQYIPEQAVKGGRLFPANSLIVATSATIGEHALVTVPHLSNQRFTSLALKKEYQASVDMKFAYYYGFVLDKWCRSNAMTSSFASVDMAGFKRFKFPLPPLVVQREIVRVLDEFTQLEAQLKAELEARRRQYAYYLSVLFSYPPNDVEFKTFSELGTFSRGGGPQKKDFQDAGVGCIHYGQIYTHYGVSTRLTNKFVDPVVAGKSKHADPGDVIIAVTSENDDDLARGVAWLGPDRVAVSNHTMIYKSAMEPRFVSYYLRTAQFDNAKRRFISGTKVKALPMRAFENIKIPVPSYDEQRQVADTLDAFDTLVNDLSIGLPAELNARRKQYEYYRDKLLTFEEAAA